MNIQVIFRIFPILLKYLPTTLYIFIISAILGLLLASIVTVLRLKRIPLIDKMLKMYVSFMRSTPGIIHIFMIYYGLPVLLRVIGINIDQTSRMTYSIIALVLFNGAFISEILRPGYLAVSKDQFEAGESVGMTKWQVHKQIIIPQMIPTILPSLSNALVDLLQDTSLLYLIGLVDMMGEAEIIISNNYGVNQMEVYLVIGLIYWGLCSLIDWITQKMENRMIEYL